MNVRLMSVLFFIIFALSLIACGGGGTVGGSGQFQGLRVTSTKAHLNLPITDVTALKVWTSAWEESPAANGQVTVKVFNDGPQYSEVRNTDGKLVASAFIGKNRTTIDMESTAEVLTYFAIGGPLQRGNQGSQALVLASIKTLPGFDGVVTAVTNAVNTNGFVPADDTAIDAALDAIADSVFATSQHQAPTTRGPKIEPTKIISGLEIDDSVNDQIRIKNTAFRRAYMWLVRTGFKDSQGNKHDLVEGIAAEPIIMPGRYGGTVDSATGLITGQYSWIAADMDPHPVSYDIGDVDNEEEVYYELTTVGVGRTPGDFDKLTTDQFDQWQELVYWTSYLDFYLPVFANLALPLDGSGLDSLCEYVYKDSRAKAWISGAPSLMPSIASLTAQGNFPGAVAAFVGSSHMPAIADMTADIMLDWAHQYGSTLFRDEQDMQNRIHAASNNIGMHNLAAAIDKMAPLSDIQNADQANIFKITSERSNVKLIADNEEIGLTDTANIEAVIKNKDTSKTYRYEWKVDNSNFFLQDVGGNSTDESPGGILKSSHEKVFIGNLSNNEGTPTITCSVYIGNTLVGVATTRVAFKDKVKEGTATYKTKFILTQSPQGGDRWNSGVVGVAEVPKVEGAAHYAIVIEDEDGQDLLRKNWAPNSPPPATHPTLWAQQKPDNVYWICFDASLMEGYASYDIVQSNMMATVAAFNAKYATVKMKVTVYFD